MQRQVRLRLRPPPRSLTQTEISRFSANSPELAGFVLNSSPKVQIRRSPHAGQSSKHLGMAARALTSGARGGGDTDETTQ
jgi:hypothetical protein